MSILEMFNLNGKNAVITGGGRGLGKGMAESLCEAGATVVIIGSSDKIFETSKTAALDEQGTPLNKELRVRCNKRFITAPYVNGFVKGDVKVEKEKSQGCISTKRHRSN